MTVAAATSILASGWASGLGAGFTIAGMPAIIAGGASSEVMLREWRFQFTRGQYFVPTLGMLNAINYFSVAYHAYKGGAEWRGFAAAGLSTLFIVPYTLTFIMSTNATLMAEHDSAKKVLGEAAIKRLVKKWSDLNIVRVIVPMIGTGLALWNFSL
ncbi:hypothetical protein GGR57DRAFT_503741 [Xylariaceae sp. FL1272]|nr:hypothetical protein GGR57DRAFT_503741 [Xylariaceae sp. FL1272]